jgi:hypothetical protein
MNALETYLEELYATRISGGAVKETSYYPALSNLLNEVGKTLKPRVRCIINMSFFEVFKESFAIDAID